MGIIKHVVIKKTLMKMVDLGPNSDCSELESKSEDESQTGTNIETKVSVQGEIKEKEEWNHQSHQSNDKNM